ncbi:hypothetical protein LSTR_LSTR006786 [Laodelphax striatellus]|uniref:Peptidase S1 domain-containing protein n=1 Tax=Laodelphax striatellus TaxID=195883 RepID=A0A482WSY8_LAOST|nr:hypothetical protein LSTR_LSTR006786 [Laodelphax striatellus]
MLTCHPWKPHNLHSTTTSRSTTSRHTPGTTHDSSPFTSTEDSFGARPSSTEHPSSSSASSSAASSASSSGSGSAVASSSSSSFAISSTTDSSVEIYTAAYSPIGYEVECGLSNYSSFTSGKIVGGVAAERGQFPWQISLQILTDTSARHICGGAIVSAHWIVTAAHCVYRVGPEKLSVVAGDYNLYTVEGHEQRRRVVKVIRQNYVRQNFSNDIALLQVWPKLRLDGYWTAPICIPISSLKFDSGSATVTGWGRMSENGALAHILQQVTLPIMPKKRCNELYESAGYGDYLNKCQMCCGWEEGGLDSCQGDSGGPLICGMDDGRFYLCGIVSWGVGCARPKFPGVYTLVPCFTDWIISVIYKHNIPGSGHYPKHRGKFISEDFT